MAFTPSYNILDKDTHSTLVEALKSGGIGYTEADGTVHKISDTYASGGGSSLPEVTSDDNGDVLTVVSGEWAKAAPSGANIAEVYFIGTPARDGDLDPTGATAYGATFAEVKTAIQSSTAIKAYIITDYSGDGVINRDIYPSNRITIYPNAPEEYDYIEFIYNVGGTSCSIYWLSDGTITNVEPD